MEKPIGGYFEWEFPPVKNHGLHRGEVLLNSCRHSLEFILRNLRDVSTVWIPYFTCEVVLEPFNRLNIPYKYYRINKSLEIASEITLAPDEYLLYTNYYGIKDSYVESLVPKYGNKLIIDNAQALFCKSHDECHQIYSPRKYVGMPDGGLLVSPLAVNSCELSMDHSYGRCSHLLKRLELLPSEGYKDFQDDDDQISSCELSRMSAISQKIFGSVDFEFIKQRRRENFETLHKALGNLNRLNIPSLDSFECPLVYPYWVNDGKALKKSLIANNIFVATYWPNVFDWVKLGDLEYELAADVVCIPIDQRYLKRDMDRIIKEIKK